jgi:hypothetical protein
MTDPERNGFSRRHREGVERVRQKNLEGREASNVVPLRRPAQKREFRLPAMPSNPLVLWAGIVAILIVVYFVQQAL